MQTTLNQIKAKSPCAEGYSKLLKFLGKTKANNEPLDLSTIFESNGFDDVIWCFRAVSGGYEKELRLFAVFCARQVQHLLTDPRSIAVIDVAERYANGNATDQELTAARDTVYAAYSTANAAYSTANAADAAAYSAAAYSAAAYYDAAYAAANAAAYAARVADPEIKPVLESYLKNLLSEK